MRAVWSRLQVVPRLLAAATVVAVLVALVITFVPRDERRTMTVDFPRTVSLYEGSDVRILGVPVGRVEQISPRGDTVRVELSYDAEHLVPADVSAAIVSPAIVGDRFVQLAPAYSGGPTLQDGAVLDASKAQVPVELDSIYRSIDDLAVALGPNGANEQGSLSELLDTSAQNLDGQGAKINQTIKDFSQLSTTLANNKDELFGSVQQINSFVRMLRTNDATVRAFNASLADASETLSGERDDLAATLEELAKALSDVERFVTDNRELLRANIDDLTSITQTLVKNRRELDKTLRDAPIALSNLALGYNKQFGTLDQRAPIVDALEDALTGPDRTLCALLGETGEEGDVCSALAPLLPPIEAPGGSLPLPRADPSGGDDASSDGGPRTQTSVEQIMGVAP